MNDVYRESNILEAQYLCIESHLTEEWSVCLWSMCLYTPMYTVYTCLDLVSTLAVLVLDTPKGGNQNPNKSNSGLKRLGARLPPALLFPF